jgi:hypothetical protein
LVVARPAAVVHYCDAEWRDFLPEVPKRNDFWRHVIHVEMQVIGFFARDVFKRVRDCTSDQPYKIRVGEVRLHLLWAGCLLGRQLENSSRGVTWCELASAGGPLYSPWPG